MSVTQRTVPCLWFDHEAEEAANQYVGIFPDSRIVAVTRYGSSGFEVHGKPAGTVLTLEFELAGQRYTALNGGPVFRFNEAISIQILCDTQEEIDHYWERLIVGGDPEAQQCGWLKDRFGLSWQVVPVGMIEMLSEPDTPGARAAFEAMMQMKKIDLAALHRAFDAATVEAGGLTA